MNQRRSKIQIVYDLLSAANQKKKIKITHLLYKGNLSHLRLKGYVDDLLKKKLLIEIKEDNHTFYKITEQGVKFLSDIEKMREVTEAFGL